MITLMAEPKTYQMLGGGTITGSTPEEIVAAMRADSWDPCESVEDFMEATSRACRGYSKAIISTYNAEEFVTDLIYNEFLVEASEAPGNVIEFPNDQP